MAGLIASTSAIEWRKYIKQLPIAFDIPTYSHGTVSVVDIPVISRRNIILQVIRHFSVSWPSEISWLGSSVVLKHNLKGTVRTSSRNGEIGSERSVDGCEKVMELFGRNQEKWLLVGIKGSTIQIEAKKGNASVSIRLTFTFQVSRRNLQVPSPIKDLSLIKETRRNLDMLAK